LLWHVAAEGPGALALLDQGVHAAQDPVVDAADALGREFALRGQQDVAELVDELPRRRDQPAQRAGRVARGVGGVQDRVGPLHGPDQDGVNEIGAGLEVAVEGDPADARGRGDAGDAHVGIARQAVRSRIEDRGDVAAGIGPLSSRSRHPKNPFLNSRV
jgi:hypothetical protein